MMDASSTGSVKRGAVFAEDESLAAAANSSYHKRKHLERARTSKTRALSHELESRHVSAFKDESKYSKMSAEVGIWFN
jgi:hypothetical protein